MPRWSLFVMEETSETITIEKTEIWKIGGVIQKGRCCSQRFGIKILTSNAQGCNGAHMMAVAVFSQALFAVKRANVGKVSCTCMQNLLLRHFHSIFAFPEFDWETLKHVKYTRQSLPFDIGLSFPQLAVKDAHGSHGRAFGWTSQQFRGFDQPKIIALLPYDLQRTIDRFNNFLPELTD